jgi:hypothetical protein
MTEYEYAGFIFLVEDGKVIKAKPGQHPAAYKDKHRWAAQLCYDADHIGE